MNHLADCLILKVCLAGIGLVVIGFCCWILYQAIQSRRRHRLILQHIKNCKNIEDVMDHLETKYQRTHSEVVRCLKEVEEEENDEKRKG